MVLLSGISMCVFVLISFRIYSQCAPFMYTLSAERRARLRAVGLMCSLVSFCYLVRFLFNVVKSMPVWRTFWSSAIDDGKAAWFELVYLVLLEGVPYFAALLVLWMFSHHPR